MIIQFHLTKLSNMNLTVTVVISNIKVIDNLKIHNYWIIHPSLVDSKQTPV